METNDFLQFFPNYCIQTFDDNETKDKQANLISCGKPSSFTQEQLQSLNEKGAGIYFTPNQFPTGDRKAANCVGVNAWIVENDELSIDEQWKNLQNAPLPPSFIVQSKKSLHAYWLAENGTIENYEHIVKGLIKYFNGDKACKDICRVFRVPGYYHKKNRNEPFLVGLVDAHPERKYSEAEMMWNYPYTEEIPSPPIPQEIRADDFWGLLGSLDNKSVLEKLSGQPIINNEKIEFTKRRPNGEYIIVNGTPCDGWLDEKGMIGSGKRGGPTWIQWLGYYGLPKSEIARWAKDYLPEVQEWERKQTQGKETNLTIKKDYKLRYTWGTQDLDDNFGIIKRGKFIVVAAKRSAGKTTYVFDMACKNAQLGHKVLFLSLEMATDDIKDDFARKYAGITIPEERDYRIPEHKSLAYQRKQDEIKDIKNLYLRGLRDEEEISWDLIVKTINEYQDLDLIFLDNLDLIGSLPREDNLERQKRIVKNILKLTQSKNIPLILIHHYRKSPSEGKDKGMDEMAGSGKIADGADMVIKVSRNTDLEAEYPEKYSSTLFLQKCRGYNECVKKIYFIHGTFVDVPPIEM